MSYVDRIPKEEFKEYTIVEQWADYISKFNISNTVESITISKVIVKSIAYMKGECPVDLKFINCYFTDYVTLEKCKFESDLIFEGCYFDKSFFCKDIEVIKRFQLNNCFLYEMFSMSGVFNDCQLGFAYCGAFTHSKVSIGKLIIRNHTKSVIKYCKINCTDIKGDITISGNDTYISCLEIIGELLDSRASLHDINLSTLIFESFRNSSSVNIANIKKWHSDEFTKTAITIQNSYMGKCEFYNIDLTSFGILNIYNSHIVECSFINMNWRYSIASIPHIDIVEENRTVNYLAYREVHRQLKYALSKQGDSINEQKFHSTELIVYYLGLKWKGDFFTKLIIGLSYITSDFGQSIWWPIRALFVGHSLFFLFAMLTGLSSVHVSFTNASLSGLNTAVYEYFNFINPLHKTEDLPKDWTIIIDILMRIWSSYMIYNIIRASRRFIK